MTRNTYERLFEQARAALREGRCVILDATFSKREHRDALKELMAAEGWDVRWIEAHASEAVVRERLLQRDGDPSVVSDARLEDWKRLSAGYEAPDELPPEEKRCILADGEIDHVFGKLLKELVVW